jgi:serine phosphatase RsbU (regulator of sigma subunit)
MARSAIVMVAAASRPHPGEMVNGDAWCVTQDGETSRLAVVDGLGHGPAAAVAAQTALAVLAAYPALAPVQALGQCHAALTATRGAAISVVHIDPVAARLTFAGVGNVEVRVRQAGGTQRLAPARGFVGGAMPHARSIEIALDSDWLVLMHSDGVSARLNLVDLGAVAARASPALAEAILARWSRATDDATVVVASPAR